MSTSSGAAGAVTFANLGVPADLVDVLQRQGITRPFDIQVATIADALAGRDVLGRAPTGSGKTLAFGIPLIASLVKAKPKRPTAMVLSPTRELAEQIRRELEPLAAARDRTVLSIYGGVGFRDQLQGLRNGVDVIVACPGRLVDLLDQGALSLDAVRSVVVDEADRMADMGFLPSVRQLLDLTSPKRQTVLFSATLGKEVQVLTDRYQVDPVTHEVGETEPDLTLVTHRFIKTEKLIKVDLAAQLIDEAGPTVVFCRTRHGVDRVARQLKQAGVKAGWIHGGRSQSQRDSALYSFTHGKVQALVATDVAARGIHVDGVECVIHFDPPEDDKAYTHRSGRTARAGAGGLVVSFVNSDQVKEAHQLQRHIGLTQEIEETPAIAERPVVQEERPVARRKPQGNPRPAISKRSRDAERPTVSAEGRDPSYDDVPRRSPAPSGTRQRPAPGTGAARRKSGSTEARSSGRPGRPGGGAKTTGAGRNGADDGPKRSGKPRPKNKQGKPVSSTKAAHRKGGAAKAPNPGR